MEFLTPLSERWSRERFPQVARILGRMNGRFLTGRPVPDEPWLTRDYVRMYVDSAEPVLSQLTELAKAPLVRDIYPPDAVADLQAFWTDREQFYAALAACPQVFSHFDVFTRNAFLTDYGTGRLQVTAVDWELCGVVPVGGELGSLTGASLAFLDLSPDIAEEIMEACLDAYLTGLADVEAVVSPVQVEFAALTTNAMRNALGAGRTGHRHPARLQTAPLGRADLRRFFAGIRETQPPPSKSCGPRLIEPAHCWPN